MTYRCGIDPAVARFLGELPGPPRIMCDSCGAKYEIKGRNGIPPSWFINGDAPPRWRTARAGDVRRDWCPTCKVKP